MKVESNISELQSLRHLVYGLNPLVSWLKQQGIDHRPFLKQADIPEDALSQPEYTITPAQEIGFTRDVYNSIQRPELGLILGPRYNLSNYGIIGLAAKTSTNIFQFYKVMIENLILTWTYSNIHLYTDAQYAYFEMKPERDLGDLKQYMIDRDLSSAVHICQEAIGKDLPLESLELQYPEPEYAALYQDIFKCPVRFNAESNRYIFKKQWLEEPLKDAEPHTSRIFTQQAQSITQSLRKQYSLAEHIRFHLLNSEGEAITLESIANIFNTTPRTIQRKLANEGMSFKDLQEDVRKNVAIEYLLTSQLSIDAIANRLAYNDAAAFSNAFKRWEGISPSQYRKQRG